MISDKIRKAGLLVAASMFLVVSFAFSQQKKPIKVMNFEQLKPLLHQQNDTLYVVNFWATWCAPCVEEIPYFEQIARKYKERKLKVLMVSMDFPNQLESRLIPFIEKQEMKNEVILLDAPRQNKWIPQVSDEWTGALPATLIYRNDYRKFYPQGFTFEELDNAIKSLLNN